MLDQKLLQAAFSSERLIKERARNEIIQTVNHEVMIECANRAFQNGDLEDSEFWFVEVATAPTDKEIIFQGAVQLVQKILIPELRYYEARLYVKYFLGDSTFESDQILSELDKTIEDAIPHQEVKNDNSWQEADLSVPLVKGESQMYYFNRNVSYFMAMLGTEDTDNVLAAIRMDYLPSIIGFINGVFSGTKDFGVKRETVVAGVLEIVRVCLSNVEKLPPKSGVKGYVSSAKQAPQDGPLDSEVKKNALGYGMKKSN